MGAAHGDDSVSHQIDVGLRNELRLGGKLLDRKQRSEGLAGKPLQGTVAPEVGAAPIAAPKAADLTQESRKK